ncbi:non-specific lipid transfer protein GPI-anchored 7-like [Arachis stenosperma]|uniref:non-specific lipid transfer protein GPI-anchored 7-like n=1 Tax=Arachis stenosperma TaxID=217475 RepID=UPI0025ABBA8B|nr:non-specific lipid transfer protein GPI-anchored 7-like [Arachis stenosperma]
MDSYRLMMMMMMAVVLMIVVTFGEAQTNAYPACATELVPCVEYKNSKKPPNACCNPLKNVFQTQLACLCQIVLTPAFLESFGSNTTQTIRFVRSCNLNLSVSLCQDALSAPPPSVSVKPKATAGADEGGAGRVALSGFSFQLLFWCYVLFIY